jgi:hypothetical protein
MSKDPSREELISQLALIAAALKKIRNGLGPFLVNATKRDEEHIGSIQARMVELEMAITRFGS